MRHGIARVVLVSAALGTSCADANNMSVGVAAANDASVAPDVDVTLDAGADRPETSAKPDAGCSLGDTRPCYSGPAGTENVGTCLAGTATCAMNGTWGPCIGEVVPRPDVCGGPDSNCDGHLPPQACPGDVAKQFLQHTGQEAGVMRIGVDPTNGNVVVVGVFDASVDFGLGALTSPYSSATYMLTLDSTLTPIAQRSFGGGANVDIQIDAQGRRIVRNLAWPGRSVDLGAGPIPAGTNGAQTYAMYDSTGAFVWQKVVPEQSSVSTTVQFTGIDNGKGVVLINSVAPGLLYDYGCGAGTIPGDAAVVALGAGGTCAWETRVGAHILPLFAAAQSDSSIVVSAVYDGAAGVSLGAFPLPSGKKTLVFSLDASGTVKWVRTFDKSFLIAQVAIGKSDEIYLYGISGSATLDLGGGQMPLQSLSPGGDDIVLARFDPTGQHTWSKRMKGDAVREYPIWLGVGSTALFVSGYSRQGHVDLGGGSLSPGFVGSLDLNGNHRWSVSEYTDTPSYGGVSGTSFVYAVTGSGRVVQLLY